MAQGGAHTMKTMHITGWVLVAGLAAMTAQGTLIFEDTFSDGIVTNAGPENVGYWLSQPTYGTAVEANGTLTIETTTGDSTTARWQEIAATNAHSDMHFFSKPITFSADILQISGAASYRPGLRFNVYSTVGITFQADDYFRIEIMNEYKVYFTVDV
jgi:hypothetical protein